MFLAATLSTPATTMADGRKTRWGILGTGTIASDFARILSHSSDSEIAAVGSRSLASAETFCERCDLAPAGVFCCARCEAQEGGGGAKRRPCECDGYASRERRLTARAERRTDEATRRRPPSS